MVLVHFVYEQNLLYTIYIMVHWLSMHYHKYHIIPNKCPGHLENCKSGGGGVFVLKSFPWYGLLNKCLIKFTFTEKNLKILDQYTAVMYLFLGEQYWKYWQLDDLDIWGLEVLCIMMVFWGPTTLNERLKTLLFVNKKKISYFLTIGKSWRGHLYGQGCLLGIIRS